MINALTMSWWQLWGYFWGFNDWSPSIILDMHCGHLIWQYEFLGLMVNSQSNVCLICSTLSWAIMSITPVCFLINDWCMHIQVTCFRVEVSAYNVEMYGIYIGDTFSDSLSWWGKTVNSHVMHMAQMLALVKLLVVGFILLGYMGDFKGH